MCETNDSYVEIRARIQTHTQMKGYTNEYRLYLTNKQIHNKKANTYG